MSEHLNDLVVFFFSNLGEKLGEQLFAFSLFSLPPFSFADSFWIRHRTEALFCQGGQMVAHLFTYSLF